MGQLAFGAHFPASVWMCVEWGRSKWPIRTLQVFWRSVIARPNCLNEQLCESASLIAPKAFNEIPSIVVQFFLFSVTL